MANDPHIRHVVFHSPGVNWLEGVDFRQQPGVQEHVAHYAALHGEGKLEMGGPFMINDGGGMMVTTLGTPRDELERFAASDPAVQSGLLKFEIRPWYVAMERKERS